MFKSIRTQIALLAIVPLAAFAIAIGLSLFEAVQESRRAGDVLPIAEMAGQAEAVLHELQKERGRTAVMLASGFADTPRDLLAKQRKETDVAVQAMQAAAATFSIGNEKLAERIRATSAELDELGAP